MELRPRGSATKRRRSSGELTRSRHCCHLSCAHRNNTTNIWFHESRSYTASRSSESKQSNRGFGFFSFFFFQFLGFDEMTDLAFGFLEELVGSWLRWSRRGRNGNSSQRVGLASVAGWMLACEACEVKTRSKCLVWFSGWCFQAKTSTKFIYLLYLFYVNRRSKLTYINSESSI